jgi:hypothetical protein
MPYLFSWTGHAECVKFVKKFNIPLLVRDVTIMCYFSLSGFNRLTVFSHHSGNWRWWIHQGECSKVLGCWNWGPFRHRTPKWYLIYSFSTLYLSFFFVLLFLCEAASSLVIFATCKISHVPSVHIIIWGWNFLIILCIVFYAREFDFGIFCAEIPNNEYIEYFAPDYTLKVPNLNMVKKHLPVGLY